MRRSTLLVLTVVAVALSGCTGATTGSDPGNPNQVEVFTSWSSGQDARSFRTLIDEFQEQNPGIQVIDSAIKGVDAAATALQGRLQAGDPPDVFLAPAGAALAEMAASGRIEDLTDFADEVGLPDDVRADLLALLSVDGRIFSIPSDVHRVNVVWTNSAVLSRAGIIADVPPSDIDDWIGDLEALRAAGVAYPLAVGDLETQLVLFENVLVSEFGPEAYTTLWSDPAAGDSPTLDVALAHYLALLDFAEPTSGSSGWQPTTQHVTNGTAGYVVMSDRALSVFRDAGLTYGDQYSSFAFPGTLGTFDLLADSFAMPVGASHPDAAKAWLRTAISPEAQQAFSLAKGSIPTLAGTNGDDYPEYQKLTVLAFNLNELVPSLAYGVAAPQRWTNDIASAIQQFRHDDRPLAFANALRAAAQSALT